MGTQPRWTLDQVLALAPDAASAKAARALTSPRSWSELGSNESLVWGKCQGSGRTPYQVAVDLNEPAFTCTCPSRKFPCKQVVALLALSDDGAPTYDHENAADLAIPAFACTPDKFPDLMAAAIERRSLTAWAAANEPTTTTSQSRKLGSETRSARRHRHESPSLGWCRGRSASSAWKTTAADCWNCTGGSSATALS